jgi:cholesterol oxidase
MQLLSSPLDALKPAYDVVVVGSGYGGGVAASRLARAGLRVCVIERGREFVTGEFPNRLPELRRELQIVGGKMRSGRRTGLFDFRLGSDIHVLIGCGLGGGSPLVGCCSSSEWADHPPKHPASTKASAKLFDASVSCFAPPPNTA